jgi:polysaccharide biosynthesis protein PslH
MTQTHVRRILAVSSFFPLPADRGDPLRVGMYLRSLNAISDLTVYAVRRIDTSGPLVRELEDQLPGASLTTFAPPTLGRSRRAKFCRWAKAVVTGTPVWILNRYSLELDHALRSSASDFDAIVFLGEAAGIYSLRCGSRRKHLDKANVLSHSTAQDAALATGISLPARLTAVAWLSRRYERRVLESVHSVSVTSPEEAARLVAEHGRVANTIVPSAIDVTERPGDFDPRGRCVLWLGSLDYRSNSDGLERFLAEGVPILREAGLTLVVVGSGNSPHIVALCQRTPGVECRGFVPDLTSLTATARAAVVPLWSGAGVKLKTLTLMDLGLPIAATGVAMEGIEPAAALVVSDDCRALSQRIVMASVDELIAARERGRDAVRENFSADSFAARISASLGEIALEPSRASQ